MKYLLISLSYYPPHTGGISRLMADVVNVLGPENVLCLTSKKTTEEHVDLCKTYRVPVTRSKNPYVKSIVLAAIIFYIWLTKRPKLGLIATVDDGFIGLWLKKYYKLPYVIWAHGNEILALCNSGKPWKKAIDSLCEADRIIAVSQYTQQKVLKLGVAEENIPIVNPCCDFSQNQESEKSSCIIGGVKIPDQGKIIVTVANLVKRKGHDRVIESMPQILKEQPETYYVVVGSGRDQEYLESLVEKYGVVDNVIFAGRVTDSELSDIYSAADIFVMLSREIEQKHDVEGFGIVFLEASSFSLPVIGGRSGGIPDAIEDGKSGFIVDPLKTDEFVEKALLLLSNEELRKSMGKYGKRRTSSEFSLSRFSEKLDKVFDGISQ